MREVRTARNRAVENESRSIEASAERAIAQRRTESFAEPRRMNAVEAMANRCNVTESELREALKHTVFKECRSEAQFIALAIVANEYGLNPLLKEIFAFPTGGGVTPMVSVDGWISLMNRHPQFDSIEFDYHVDDKGEVEAIESVIYRKDKDRPTKIIEYMDECKGATKPWTKSPKRMLRHRALIQGVRVAFGFSGLGVPDDDLIEGDFNVVLSLPSSSSFGESEAGAATINGDASDASTAGADKRSDTDKACDQLVADFDSAADSDALNAARNAWLDKQDAGFFDRGQNEDLEDAFNAGCERLGIDPNTGQLLDAGNDGTMSTDNRTAAEGPDDSQRGEANNGADADDEAPMWKRVADNFTAELRTATTTKAVKALDDKWVATIRAGIPDDAAVEWIEKAIAARKRDVATPKKEG